MQNFIIGYEKIIFLGIMSNALNALQHCLQTPLKTTYPTNTINYLWLKNLKYL